jgi:hypothetical protein
LNVPEKFMEEKFILQLRNLLSEKGISFFNLVVHNEKVRDKGAKLFRDMNSLSGRTEWCRISAQRTENWVFVTDLASLKHSVKASKLKSKNSFSQDGNTFH